MIGLPQLTGAISPDTPMVLIGDCGILPERNSGLKKAS